MDLNQKYKQKEILKHIEEFIIATGQSLNRIYSKYLYPYLTDVINLNIYNIRDEEDRKDAAQNLHLAILNRIKKIKTDKIDNVHNYFFIMTKRLLLNEIEKVCVQERKKELQERTALLILDNNDVFITVMDEYNIF